MYYYLFGLFCLLLSACEAPSPPTPPTTPAPTAQQLDVALNMTKPTFALGMPVTLRFVLQNNQADSIRFCTLNSPVQELIWSNYFSVVNKAGEAMPYIGKRSLQKGPATPNDYSTLAPNEIKIYTVDLLPLYSMKQEGLYSVHFMGDTLNLLPNSTPARFVLE